MDRRQRIKRIQEQAKIIRNKRLARKASNNSVTVNKGVVKSEVPSPQLKEKSNLSPPSKAEIRRKRAERVLKQRLELKARREKLGIGQKRGCGGCRRKVGNR